MHVRIAVVVAVDVQLTTQLTQVLLRPLVPHLKQAEVDHGRQQEVAHTAVALLRLAFVFVLLLHLQSPEFVEFDLYFFDVVLELSFQFGVVCEQQHV